MTICTPEPLRLPPSTCTETTAPSGNRPASTSWSGVDVDSTSPVSAIITCSNWLTQSAATLCGQPVADAGSACQRELQPGELVVELRDECGLVRTCVVAHRARLVLAVEQVGLYPRRRDLHHAH